MALAGARIQTTQSRVKRTNDEATMPLANKLLRDMFNYCFALCL